MNMKPIINKYILYFLLSLYLTMSRPSKTN